MAKSVRTHKLTGTAGELYTAFQLCMLGVECDLVKQDGTDIVAIKSTGLQVAKRIEVKTSTHINEKNQYSFTTSKGGQKRPYTKEDCDILALVALPERKIHFFPVSRLLTTITKKIHVDTFIREEDLIKRTWEYSLERSLIESKELLEEWYKNK